MQSILADLAAEHDQLAGLLDGRPESDWQVDTPATGWRVVDQISHLAFFDEQASLATTQPDAFTEGIADVAEFEARHLAEGRRLGGPATLAWWRGANDRLRADLVSLDPRDRILWFGPTMSARSFVTARIMETWAHGQDVVDALSLDRPATDRLRHVAHLGVATFGWSFVNRGLAVPDDTVRVELESPSGEQWVWHGDGEQLVMGTALDFCLLVTQRRHRRDLALVAEGAAADRWLDIAQCFAGPPGPGRPPQADGGPAQVRP